MAYHENITHPDKIYWKKGKITKKEMIAYYKQKAPKILPYLKDRPLVMRRFPNGVDRAGFFQKEAGKNLPPFVKVGKVKHKERVISYILVNNIQTLIYVANLGAIELHTFHSRIQTLDTPDYLLFDLDPQGVAWDRVIEVALALHKKLDAKKMPNHCNTTGKRGLHIRVPLKKKQSYAEAKKWAQQIAKELHEELKPLTSLERSPAKRKGKVYLDVLQNGKGQTAICPYSLRATPNATIAMPLSWSQVKKGLKNTQFTL